MNTKKISVRLAAIAGLSAVLVSSIWGTAVSFTYAAETVQTETEETVLTETGETEEEAAAEEAQPETDNTENGQQAEAEPPQIDESTLTATEKKWLNRVMVDVEDSLNVRAKASKDADVVGKMYATSVAKVVKIGEEWTLIKSGNVKGYVKNSYCIYGLDALAHMKEVCYKAATVTSTTLNIRAKASTTASILKVALKGTPLKYIKKSGTDWVKVSYGDVKGFVYKKYVDIGYNTTTAKTLEEIAAEKEAEKAAKEKAANAYDANADEVTLLAGIIQCEAGSEPYEGQVAVGAVVLNRVRNGSYPNTIYGVIYQAHQFGPASTGKLARVIANGSISSSCRRAAEEALAGTDPTSGKLHFNRNNGAGGLVIGNHRFW